MRKYFDIYKARLYLFIAIAIAAIILAVSFLCILFAPYDPLGQTSDKITPGSTDKTNKPSYREGRVYPLHTDVISTTFWIGEVFSDSLSDGSQVCSTYDTQWAYHWSGGIDRGRVSAGATGCAGSIFGGCDGIVATSGRCEVERRVASKNYFPSQITPKENPFYLDLPYDDLNDPIAFAERCNVIPWADDPGYTGHCTDRNFSYMKNKFVRITGPSRTVCYGQVEDAGPSHDNLYHDSAYVFGVNDARPLQQSFNNAGMDVSPALNSCLGYADLNGQNDRVEWQFVDIRDVPDGPWKKVITSSGVTR